MIISMTGYGRGSAAAVNGRMTVEIKVVNSRFLDQKVRGIDLRPELEFKLREEIRNRLQRGSVTVSVAIEDASGSSASPVFNRERFEALDNIITAVQREYGRHVDLNEVITSADLFLENGQDEIGDKPVLQAAGEALKQVSKMRAAEGRKLADELIKRVSTIHDLLTKVTAASAGAADERKAILKTRLQELAGEMNLDENRINQEIVILADRYDLSEEMARCGSHLEQFKGLMNIDEPVGKRLNFLLQEIGREINTIGSKSNLTSVVNLVVEMKDQVEQIREQVQNIL